MVTNGSLSGIRFELNGENDVRDDHREQPEADDPEDFTEAFQKRRVLIDCLWSEKDLQIANHVAGDESDKCDTREGYNPFTTNG